MSKEKKLDKFIFEAIGNIRKDREVTHQLLSDIINYIGKNEQNHKEVGLTAAKYVETLQRSNEQLVKLASLVQKKESQTSAFSFSPDDKNQLYDLIKDEDEEE